MLELNRARMGYVLAYKSTGSWLNKMIVKRQLEAGFSEKVSEFTHIEISGGERHSINIRPPKSTLIEITQVHKGREVAILRYYSPDFTVKRYKVAYFSAALCANKDYDVAGILAFMKNKIPSWLKFAFRWLTHDNRLYFCSEGAAAAYRKVFPRVFALEDNKIMPAHFLASNKFDVVWQGKID